MEAAKPIERTMPSLARIGLTLALLALFDALALVFAYMLIGEGRVIVTSALLIVTVLINAVSLSERLYPLRWLVPGLILMLLMVVYPAVYTFYVAFTNYSDGHLLTKEQVITQFEQEYYIPPDSPTFAWHAYRSPDGRYAAA